MGVGLPNQSNYSSKAVCDASKRTYAKNVQSCEFLPGGSAQCDQFYVCDGSGKCNPCQTNKTKANGHRSGNQCMPMPGNCNNPTGWQ